MKINMIVEKTRTGYSAYAENYPVFTVGKTLDELKFNLIYWNLLTSILKSLEKLYRRVISKFIWTFPSFLIFIK